MFKLICNYNTFIQYFNYTQSEDYNASNCINKKYLIYILDSYLIYN